MTQKIIGVLNMLFGIIGMIVCGVLFNSLSGGRAEIATAFVQVYILPTMLLVFSLIVWGGYCFYKEGKLGKYMLIFYTILLVAYSAGVIFLSDAATAAIMLILVYPLAHTLLASAGKLAPVNERVQP